MKTTVLKTTVFATALALSKGCSTAQIKNTKTSDLSSGVNKVAFKSQGVKLTGNLYLPANFNSSKKYPTIVFSGPFNQAS